MKSAPRHGRNSDDTDLRFNLHRLIMADDDLNALGKNCASVLLFGFMNAETGRCDPTYDKIAKALGTDRRSAMRGVQALATAGYVNVRHTFRTAAGAQFHSNNVFEFAFDRLGRPAPKAAQVAEGGGDKFDTTPGDNSDTTVVTNLSPGVVSELSPQENKERENKEREQDSPGPFGEGGLPETETPPFDFDNWFEQWWLQYPDKTKKAMAKNLAKAVLKGRRRDGFKATPAELMAGVMRYAASDDVRRGFIMSPVTWFTGACWLDERAARPFSGGRASVSSDAVWAAGAAMAARSKRATG